MGSGHSKKEALALIAHPDSKADLEKLFNAYDKDKNGSLDRKEWKDFGKLLYQVNVEDANAAGREEAIQLDKQTQTRALAAAGMTLPSWAMNKPLQHKYVAELVKPHDIDAWVSHMFDVADKDKTGNITFTEFYSFLQIESKAEADKQKDNVVVAAHDPIARAQANRECAPGSALRPSWAPAMNKAMLHGMGIQGTMTDELVAGKYTPGEINNIQLEQINKCPEMKALYESNRPLVTDFFIHGYDHARSQRTLDANPELQKAYTAMAAQMQQAFTGVAPNPALGPQVGL